MRGVSLLMVMALTIAVLIGSAGAVQTICPFDTPDIQNLDMGNAGIFTVSDAGMCDGTLLATDTVMMSSTRDNVTAIQSYEGQTMTTGGIQYVASANVASSRSMQAVDYTKAYEFPAQGQVMMDSSEYSLFKASQNCNGNLTNAINEQVYGGAFNDLNMGQSAFNLHLSNIPAAVDNNLAVSAVTQGSGSVSTVISGTSQQYGIISSIGQTRTWTGRNVSVSHQFSYQFAPLLA